MYKAKILVLGPCKSGKTVISNFLSEATESSGGEYHPTMGCRILEFELDNVYVENKTVKAELELWDVSGDHKFENCWPAIAKDANGVVFVFNPDTNNHDKDLETWFEYFVEHQGLRDAQCVIFAHHKEPIRERDAPSIPSSMQKIQCVHTNVDDDGDTLRDEFFNFTGNLLTTIRDKREQDENNILNDR